MASHRQNVHHIFLFGIRSTLMIRKIHLRFSRFDKEAELFDRYGVLEQVKEVTWRRSGNWDSPFYVGPSSRQREVTIPQAGINPLKVENGMLCEAAH